MHQTKFKGEDELWGKLYSSKSFLAWRQLENRPKVSLMNLTSYFQSRRFMVINNKSHEGAFIQHFKLMADKLRQVTYAKDSNNVAHKGSRFNINTKQKQSV